MAWDDGVHECINRQSSGMSAGFAIYKTSLETLSRFSTRFSRIKETSEHIVWTVWYGSFRKHWFLYYFICSLEAWMINTSFKAFLMKFYNKFALKRLYWFLFLFGGNWMNYLKAVVGTSAYKVRINNYDRKPEVK